MALHRVPADSLLVPNSREVLNLAGMAELGVRHHGFLSGYFAMGR